MAEGSCATWRALPELTRSVPSVTATNRYSDFRRPHAAERVNACSGFGRKAGPGVSSGVAPPVPIPNTEVKRPSVDDTGGVAHWENRPMPGPKLHKRKPSGDRRWASFYALRCVLTRA